MSIHFSLPSSTDQPINLLDGWRLRDTRGQSSRSASAKVQQELLRHANIATTMNVYTQAVSEQKRAAHGQVVEQLLAV